MSDDYKKIREMLLNGQRDEVVAREAAAVPALIDALKDEDWNVRWRAASALVEIGLPAVTALSDALKDKNGNVRWMAAEALGKIGSPAVPALIDALKDKDTDVRWYAVEVLGRIAEKTEINLRAVEKALRGYVDSVKLEGDLAETKKAEKEAAGSYVKITAAARKRVAGRQSLAGDGIILVGELPRPPSDGKKGMYRTGREGRAIA